MADIQAVNCIPAQTSFKATKLESFGSSLDGVRIAYMDGLRVAYALSCASMGVACILSLFSRRKSIGEEAATSVMEAA